MDGTIHFQGRPDSVEAVQWSADAEVAIAFRSYAEVLTPKYPLPSSSTSTSELSRWHVTRIKPNTFSVEELPYIQSQPLIDFSIGAEQSSSHIVSLEWSGPGLADNGRCALAVLTSNHILSVWTSSGAPSDDINWHRALIINPSFPNPAPAEFNSATHGPSLSPRPSHARRFAWSSGKVLLLKDEFLEPAGAKADAHYMAVVNDFGSVAVIQVKSPSALRASEGPTWNATVVSQISHSSFLEDSEPNAVHFAAPHSLSYKNISSLKGMYWSPWIITKNSTKTETFCVLALMRNDVLLLKMIREPEMTLSNQTLTPDGILNVKGRYTNGLGWFVQEGQLSLFVIEGSAVTCYRVSFNESVESCLQVKTVKLQTFEDLWVKISGTAGNPFQGTIFVTSHSSVQTRTKDVLQKVSFLDELAESPDWENRLIQAIDDYSTKHGLDGNVLTKIWGLSASPCGEYVACIFTLHPSQMLQYEQTSQAKSTLKILYQGPQTSTPEDEASKAVSLLVSTAIRQITSFEGLHYSLIRLFRNLEEDQAASDTVYRVLKNHAGELQLLQRSSVKHDQGSDFEHTLNFHEKLYEMDTFLTCMVHELRCAAGTIRNGTKRNRQDIARNIANTILEFMSDRPLSHPTDISIMALSRVIACNPPDVVDSTYQDSRASDNSVEKCGICGGSINFESTDSSRCNLGHRFVRCSMSFLSIQIPGKTRSCRMCKAPYLKTQSLVEYQPFEPAPVLAALLAQVVQLCIFCGGKFET